jgi:3-oxoacyl-[acyl-carrier-protein] synthase-3
MRDAKGEEMTVYLHSLGHFHPENKIDNRFLEQLDIGTDNEWIVSRTGIRTRHTVLPLDYICATRNRDPRCADEASIYSNAETGCRAASMALGRAGLTASDIGMVIAGGSAPRMGSPAEACLIADRLGISAPCFDLNSACSTFIAQLRFLYMLDTAAAPDFILLVHPENLTRTVDYSDRRTAVLIGDCTSAAIVSHRVPSSVQIGPVTLESDPAGWRKVSIPAMGHLQQDGAAVQNFAIRKMSALVEHLRPRTPGDCWFVGHQANLPMLQSVCVRAGIDPSRHLYNVDSRGNCGCAGSAAVISERFSQFGAGDDVLLAVVGAGLTWAGSLLHFRGETVQ